MVRVFNAYDHIAVARKFEIRGSVALIISERSVGEYDQRKSLAVFCFFGREKIYRHFSVGTVVFESLNAVFIHKNTVALRDGIRTCCGPSFIVCEEKSREGGRCDENSSHKAAEYDRCLLLCLSALAVYEPEDA